MNSNNIAKISAAYKEAYDKFMNCPEALAYKAFGDKVEKFCTEYFDDPSIKSKFLRYSDESNKVIFELMYDWSDSVEEYCFSLGDVNIDTALSDLIKLRNDIKAETANKDLIKVLLRNTKANIAAYEQLDIVVPLASIAELEKLKLMVEESKKALISKTAKLESLIEEY